MSKIQLVDINDQEFKDKVLEILTAAIKVSPFKSNRFIALPDGWIRDLTTGLDWGKSSDKVMNFNDAKEYCENKGGRLPTVDELQTILDRTMYNPTADKNIFKDVKSEWYWTSTKYAGNSSCSWCVSFCGGDVGSSIEGYDYYVRAFRSSQ
jgi:hypothetical protein